MLHGGHVTTVLLVEHVHNESEEAFPHARVFALSDSQGVLKELEEGGVDLLARLDTADIGLVVEQVILGLVE